MRTYPWIFCFTFLFGCQSDQLSKPSPIISSSQVSPVPVMSPLSSPNPSRQPVLYGQIYDWKGGLVDDVTVNVRGISSERRFDKTYKSIRGGYRIEDVSGSTPFSLTIEKPGWKSQTKTFLAMPYPVTQDFKVNFGGDVPGCGMDLSCLVKEDEFSQFIQKVISLAPSQDTRLSYYGMLNGVVFDDSGNKINNYTVKVMSLRSCAPFFQEKFISGENFSVTGVPTGYLVSISIEKRGWTSRTKTTTLLPFENSSEDLNFGGPLPNGGRDLDFLQMATPE